MFKTILLVTLVALSACYTVQNNVLVLTDADFPSITTEFEHILIQFYAPWCGHCKSLAPVYDAVATQLNQKGSSLKLAKLDATQHKEAPAKYQVQGYPTLIFFYKGQQIAYNGPRTKQGMINWLEKRIRDPISQIDAEQYKALSQSQSVSVVYHGDISSAQNNQILKKLAIGDDYNTYYFGNELGQQQGTIQIIRSFDQPVTKKGIDSEIKSWIDKYDTPFVVDFNERTITQVFGKGAKALVFFNGQSNDQILNIFTQTAKQYQGESIIFSEIKADNQHIDNFAQYIKLDRKSFPIVLIQSKSQTKYVMKQQISQQNILEFLGNLNQYKYKLTEQVKAQKVQNGQEL